MAKGKPTDPALRAEIVSKIREEGMSVSVASATYCPDPAILNK